MMEDNQAQLTKWSPKYHFKEKQQKIKILPCLGTGLKKKKNTVNIIPCLQGGKDTIVPIAFISLYNKKISKKYYGGSEKHKVCCLDNRKTTKQ